MAARRKAVIPLSPLNGAIHKQTAQTMIRDKIVSLIASGILQVRDELPGERELASMLMVSRETARGAVRQLAAEGIVRVSHGMRTRVAKGKVAVERIGITNPEFNQRIRAGRSPPGTRPGGDCGRSRCRPASDR